MKRSSSPVMSVLDISPGRVESFCGGLGRIGLTARPGLSRHRGR